MTKILFSWLCEFIKVKVEKDLIKVSLFALSPPKRLELLKARGIVRMIVNVTFLIENKIICNTHYEEFDNDK